MLHLKHRVHTFLDGQYRCPHGWFGSAIGTRMSRQHQPEMEWTLTLLRIQPQGHILEIGCGAGKAIERVAELVSQGQICGIDLSPTMIRVARRRNHRNVIAGKVDLYQGTVVALPFAHQQFDAIFSIHSVYFWPDQHQALSEVYRVLKPQGSIVLTFSPGTISAHEDLIAPPGRARLQESISADMARIGFTTVTLHHGPQSRQFATVAVVGSK
jgi:ubiquinone/menaquinone biosynthesis C-methylase UbiE